VIENGLIVPLLFCGGFLLVVVYAWYFVFGKSAKAVLTAVLGAWLGREDLVDPDSLTPVERPEGKGKVSDRFDAHAEAIKSDFHAEVYDDDLPLPKANIPPQEQGDKAKTTKDIGWPRTLSDEEKQSRRPFRHSRLKSDSDGTLDNDFSDETK
jgi:hypothetical protein